MQPSYLYETREIRVTVVGGIAASLLPNCLQAADDALKPQFTSRPRGALYFPLPACSYVPQVSEGRSPRALAVGTSQYIHICAVSHVAFDPFSNPFGSSRASSVHATWNCTIHMQLGFQCLSPIASFLCSFMSPFYSVQDADWHWSIRQGRVYSK